MWIPKLDPSKKPLYQALADALAEAIDQQELTPGTRLPTHRALASALKFTVGTVTRAYAEAERRGLISAQVGRGTYVLETHTSFQHLSQTPSPLDFSLSLPIPNPQSALWLQQSLVKLSQQGVQNLLDYQNEQGLLAHRQQISRSLQAWGLPIEAESLLICQGGQHAIALALQSVAHAGDVICSSALTYPGMIAAARQLGLKHQGLAFDQQGLIPQAFERQCQHQRPRALYLIPNQDNPTCACLPLERRQAIAAIAREYQVWLLEDDVQLNPSEQRLPSLLALAPERTLHISSFSKLVAGGLRVGMLQVPASLLPHARANLKAQCWMVSPLAPALICQGLADASLLPLIEQQRQEIQARQALVQKYLGRWQVRAQPWGFNVWLPLPEPWRASQFVDSCRRAGLEVKSAEPFAVGSYPAPQSIRFCISAPAQREQVEQGLEILVHLLEQGCLPHVQTL